MKKNFLLQDDLDDLEEEPEEWLDEDEELEEEWPEDEDEESEREKWPE